MAESGGRHELLVAVLLGLAAVGSAWNAFQAARWGGEQAAATLQTNRLLAQANEANTLAAEVLILDVVSWLDWIDAVVDGDTPRAAFLEARLRSELQPAFRAWLAEPRVEEPGVDRPVPPGTPFQRGEYRVAARERTVALHREAAESGERAQVANRASTSSVAAIVPFAVVLCLAGVASKLETSLARRGLLVLAAGVFVAGVVGTVLVPVLAGA